MAEKLKTTEEVMKLVNFIKANEKLVGENTVSAPDTLNRGLKEFISYIIPIMNTLNEVVDKRTKYEDKITQDRVNALMGVSTKCI